LKEKDGKKNKYLYNKTLYSVSFFGLNEKRLPTAVKHSNYLHILWGQMPLII